MKLSRLLELHFAHQNKDSLTDNFGDGLLCKSNKIYSNIRSAAQSGGFRFSSEHNNAYSALPLSQLRNIMDQKIIPYIDNVTVLKSLESQWPQLTAWDDIQDNLKRNFLFHESCHAVARSAAKTITIETEPELVLQMLIEESYANTCELVGVVDATEPAHKIFYELNSYSCLIEQRTFLKSAAKDVGEAALFKFLFMMYLHSNFLMKNLNEAQFAKVVKLSLSQEPGAAAPGAIPPGAIKNLKMLAKICFTLDERFKLVTTRFYLKLSGLKSGQHDLLNFDFMGLILESAAHRKLIDQLVQIATKS